MREKQFRKLTEAAKRKDVNVTRNGQVIRLNVLDVLVGDLLQIETGEIISVDGIVVKSNRLKTD
jgi:P-type Ca2+ transporter type 2C